MRTNADITLFNKYITGGVEAYHRNQVRQVAWESHMGAVRLQNGTSIQANLVYVYIPMVRENYVDPIAWKDLATKGDFWTLKSGDVIVKGLLEAEITSGYTLSNLKADYGNVFTVSSVDPMDNGSISLAHWKVIAS